MEEYKSIPEDSIFFDLTPEELTVFFFLVGFVISPTLTIDELNALANGLFLVAQVLFTVAAQRTLLNEAIHVQKEQEEAATKEKEAAKQEKENKKTVEKLETEIKKLQDQINSMQKQLKK